VSLEADALKKAAKLEEVALEEAAALEDGAWDEVIAGAVRPANGE